MSFGEELRTLRKRRQLIQNVSLVLLGLIIVATLTWSIFEILSPLSSGTPGAALLIASLAAVIVGITCALLLFGQAREADRLADDIEARIAATQAKPDSRVTHKMSGDPSAPAPGDRPIRDD